MLIRLKLEGGIDYIETGTEWYCLHLTETVGDA